MRRSCPRPFRALAAALLACLFLSSTGRATWSIVVVCERTGEVAVCSATCLTNRDLAQLVPLILVGVGGAAAQSSIDSGATNRRLIWDEMQQGTHPQEILALLRQSDSNHQSRQYGLGDIQLRRKTFTGSNALAWAGGVVGRFDGCVYAIQGNILVDENVVLDCEQALLNTPGALPEKLMAAMEAAAAAGGDSRCTSGGKSADIGFMILARMGDVDGVCDGPNGCANGQYYMDLNVANQARQDPDPVLQLRSQFTAWRASLQGRPDHLQSTKTWTDETVPGNGTARSTLELELIDWEGNPLGLGGASVSVQHSAASAGLSSLGPVVDHGDGRYSVECTAGVGQGIDEFEVRVDDGAGEIQLWRNPVLVHGETLVVSAPSLSASAGGSLDLDLIGPEAPAGRDYLLVASTSGTDPGIPVQGVQLPLNHDLFLLISFRQRNGSVFVDTQRTLAADGTARARFVAPPNSLNPLVGGAISFAYLTLNPVDFPSSPVTVQIDP